MTEVNQENTVDLTVNNEEDNGVGAFMDGYTMVYNPKPPRGSEINDIHMNKVWNHKTNVIKSYPEAFAKYLKEKYQFLQFIYPENIKDIKKLMKNNPFKCPHKQCIYETDKRELLEAHLKKAHKMDDDVREMIKEIEVVNPESGSHFTSYKDKVNASKNLSPESLEGIPDTSKREVKDSQGVTWYGAGWEQDSVDSGMMKPKRPGMFNSY